MPHAFEQVLWREQVGVKIVFDLPCLEGLHGCQVYINFVLYAAASVLGLEGKPLGLQLKQRCINAASRKQCFV
jgi:hypothetical protein